MMCEINCILFNVNYTLRRQVRLTVLHIVTSRAVLQLNYTIVKQFLLQNDKQHGIKH